MDILELKQYIDECSKYLIADSVVSDRDCEIRAGRFLDAQYRLAVGIHLLSDELFKLESIKTATYAKAIRFYIEAKNAVEKKAVSEADPDYIKASESVSEAESTLNYLKTMSRIFSDAHVFYRQKARNDGGING